MANINISINVEINVQLMLYKRNNFLEQTLIFHFLCGFVL
jgi:hypothetical protein